LAPRGSGESFQVVADGFLLGNRKLIDQRVLAALAARHDAILVLEADRGKAESAALDRDAAGLGQQIAALRDPDNQCIDRTKRLERPVQALDPALLRLERAGLLEQLVDHDPQVLAAEL